MLAFVCELNCVRCWVRNLLDPLQPVYHALNVCESDALIDFGKPMHRHQSVVDDIGTLRSPLHRRPCFFDVSGFCFLISHHVLVQHNAKLTFVAVAKTPEVFESFECAQSILCRSTLLLSLKELCWLNFLKLDVLANDSHGQDQLRGGLIHCGFYLSHPLMFPTLFTLLYFRFPL